VLVRGLAEEVTSAHRSELIARTEATGVTPWAPRRARTLDAAHPHTRSAVAGLRGRRLPLAPNERTNSEVIVLPAATFTWLGMVLAISFLEAPLKFRAPGITLPLGLGIGRIVFAALNRVEVALLLVLGVALVAGPRPPALVALVGVLAVLLGAQLGLVRPALRRRSERVLAGEEVPRSRQHLVYVALELVKVVVLVTIGATALALI
jgi:hypothetical protein